MKLIYVKSETHLRCKALAKLDGRTMMEFLDRILREEVSKVDQKDYKQAIEDITQAEISEG